MKSFGLNDGRPDGEIVVLVDDSGAVTSAKNVITNIEYVGGGGGEIPEGYAAILLNTEEGILDKTWNEINTIFSDLGVGKVVIIPDNYVSPNDNYLEFISQVQDDGHGGYSITTLGDANMYFCEDPNSYPILD